jgi:ribosomal protein S18 acetylase RimI-like enzyme
MIEVRKARLDDASLISELNSDVQNLHAKHIPQIFKPALPETFPSEFVTSLLAQPENIILIVQVDGRPAGYLFAEIRHLEENSFRYAHDQIHIHHISVQPDDQGQGCGTSLIAALKNMAANLSIHMITLDTWGFNTQAQTFFASQGFEVFNLRYWLIN